MCGYASLLNNVFPKNYLTNYVLSAYNPPEKTDIVNNDQTLSKMFKPYLNTLKPCFYHIKYDEQYMPELFLTHLELRND